MKIASMFLNNIPHRLDRDNLSKLVYILKPLSNTNKLVHIFTRAPQKPIGVWELVILYAWEYAEYATFYGRLQFNNKGLLRWWVYKARLLVHQDQILKICEQLNLGDENPIRYFYNIFSTISSFPCLHTSLHISDCFTNFF